MRRQPTPRAIDRPLTPETGEPVPQEGDPTEEELTRESEGAPEPPPSPSSYSSDSEPTTTATMTFAINPAAATISDVLLFTNKGHVIIYNQATKCLYEDPKDRYDCTPSNTQVFLDRLWQRTDELKNQVVNVPDGIGTPNFDAVTANKKNLCLNHGELTFEYLRVFAKTFLSKPTRQAQDDYMLLQCLQNSLTESAFRGVNSDKSQFTVDGQAVGILLFKTILSESSVDSSVDPDIIRNEIANAPARFEELDYDVRKLNDWAKLQVNLLHQKGKTTTDLKAHLYRAYKSSNDEVFVAYIERLEDESRDNPMTELTYSALMQRAQHKADAISKHRTMSIANSPSNKDIIAMRTELAAKLVSSIQQHMKPEAGSTNTNNGSSSNNSNNGKRRNKLEVPAQLIGKEAPTDLNSFVKINGKDWYHCFTHGWTLHPTKDCKFPCLPHRRMHPHNQSTNGNSNQAPPPTTPSTTNGDRQNRAINAFQALLQGQNQG
jgi:hypothetical protein